MLDQLSARPKLGWECLEQLVGNTPLVRLDLRFEGRDLTVFAKAEMYNYTGSIKDRMALMILKRAIEAGELQPGQRIVEATSGSSGIALAAMARALGHPITIFMPDWMSMERRALLRSHGADVVLVSREEGGFLGAMAKAKAMGEETGAFLPQQFANADNSLAHYEGTAPELLAQVRGEGAGLGAFVAGVGTGGTVMGAGRYLKEQDPTIAVHPIEPAQSPTLTNGYKCGSHRIQGLSDEFIPDLLKLDQLDPIVSVDDGDAILMAQKLCRELGLGIGISSGANLIGAIRAGASRDDGRAIGTIFCDGLMRYLSTDLCKDECAKPDCITPRVEIVSSRIIR
ncbi:PLP-dependent cysteine synthase family protein [Erythrobacter sp. YT30]|uniref:PLP-dependent cysteine synthase family protein n=1 Tax=Erythrobacter sp. YT30 TaxID=1735012 RepID=UPI00076DAB74|nr:PLP-dependent cysteine synthase family protein [Erythrobacter sp. YT30]KWV90762.1 cysteine synthase [Erythrobacter sp. YT30]